MFLSIVNDAYNVSLDVGYPYRSFTQALTTTAILYEFHSIDAPKPILFKKVFELAYSRTLLAPTKTVGEFLRLPQAAVGSEQDRAGINGWRSPDEDLRFKFQ
ncbi:hypothetical protein DFP72DRAFT_851689 [Ephemerocybe angulata]|uniref:Uncharacterized protein n=1 Tax=Ephemerocybe angulata TaxID=980116 RepID=A0A8H6HQ38_9AGAR|nr:hypothetical protein DFP72DRAFT_851689 [Tulosesus angulatus]